MVQIFLTHEIGKFNVIICLAIYDIYVPVYLCLLKELDKDKMSFHDLTFITLTLLLVANIFCGADKNETLSLTIDSQNVTSSEVSATLLEHINNSGKFFTSFQINCITYWIQRIFIDWILTNFVFLLKTDAEPISPIANVSIPIGGNATFDCMIPGSKHKLQVMKQLFFHNFEWNW